MLVVMQQVIGFNRCSNNTNTTITIDGGNCNDGQETERSQTANVGIAVGAILVGLLFLALLAFCVKKRKSTRDATVVAGMAGLQNSMI